MWGTVTIQGAGGHGAYPSGGQSPIEKAAAFIKALRAEIPENWQIEDNADENKQSLSHDLLAPKGQSFRSEERRVGKECRSQWTKWPQKKKQKRRASGDIGTQQTETKI